jgi:hypothetical protein
MPDIPKGHKVIDTVKDNKGFYRIIERPDGTKYSQTLKLFTEQDNDRKVRAENKSLGQYSTTNIKGNMANAMALTAVGGGAAALALHNATQGRQDKVGRKVRGAAFGNARPQGAGLKTPAGTAGDVRGRVSPNRPPAIVRSVDSFNQRGSTMPQSGNLFSTPKSGSRTISDVRSEPQGTFDPKAQRTAGTRSSAGQRLVKTPTSRNPNTLRLNTEPGKPAGARVQAPATVTGRDSNMPQSGTRYAPAGTAKVTGKGTRGVPRPNPRPSMKPATAAKTPVTQARPTPLNPNQRPGPLLQGQPRQPAQVTSPMRPGAAPGPVGMQGRPQVVRVEARQFPINPNMTLGAQRMPDGRTMRFQRANLTGEQSMLRPSPLNPDAPTNVAKKTGTRYAPAGTAKATGKGTRGVPRPSPRSNFKPATGAKPTGGGMPSQLNQMPKPGGGPTAPGRTNVPGAINQSKMPAQFSQMPKAGGGPTVNIPSRVTQSMPPSPLNKINSFLGKLTQGRTGIKQVDAMYQASAMIDKYGGEPYREHMAAHPGDKKMTPMQLSTHIRESKLAPAAKATPAATPAASSGNKPSAASGNKPYNPTYFPEAGRNGSAVRTPDSYLGEAFDYSLQKGTNSGTKYLEHMFRRDKVSDDDQQRLRERFNKKVVGDKTLSEYGANQGITKTLEGKKSGLGEALLGKYRDTGTYEGNTDYDVMRAAAEARMARK